LVLNLSLNCATTAETGVDGITSSLSIADMCTIFTILHWWFSESLLRIRFSCNRFFFSGDSSIACRLLFNISIAPFEARVSSASWDKSFSSYSTVCISMTSAPGLS
jgi:hypothetical protein